MTTGKRLEWPTPSGDFDRCLRCQCPWKDPIAEPQEHVMAPLDRANVVFEDPLQDYFVMQCSTNDGSNYSFVWSSDAPGGTVRFSRSGYRRKTWNIPSDAEELGGRRYRLNVALAPDSIP